MRVLHKGWGCAAGANGKFSGGADIGSLQKVKQGLSSRTHPKPVISNHVFGERMCRCLCPFDFLTLSAVYDRVSGTKHHFSDPYPWLKLLQ
jgi:hypothetical protein